MNILLLRHGESSDNHSKIFSNDNTSLTDLGKQQIEMASKKLKIRDFDKIYYSPLKRTKDSLDIVKHYFKKPSISEERLKEIDFGKFKGLTFDDIMHLYEYEAGEWMDNPFLNAPLEGESIITAYNRIGGFLDLLKERGENVLLITHDGIIRLMLCHILGSYKYFFNFKLGNASITSIVYESDYSYIDYLNL